MTCVLLCLMGLCGNRSEQWTLACFGKRSGQVLKWSMIRGSVLGGSWRSQRLQDAFAKSWMQMAAVVASAFPRCKH